MSVIKCQNDYNLGKGYNKLCST